MNATRDPVLGYGPLARQSGARWGIPPEDLLGLIHVESGGNINAISPAGAFGLTQFIPGTAARYGVRRGDAASQIEGAAHYLHDLGYARDPRLALASYNAGPGNPAAAGNYPELVQAAARRYTGIAGDGAGTPRLNGGAATRPAPSPGNPIAQHANGALRTLLTISLVGAGATLAYLGLARTAGIQHPIRTPATAATIARP